MDKKSYGQLIIMQARIDANRQYCDDKMNNITEETTPTIASMMDQIKFSKYSPDKKD